MNWFIYLLCMCVFMCVYVLIHMCIRLFGVLMCACVDVAMTLFMC